MRSVREFRQGKPGFYPDQSIYAEFACAEFGLTFRDLGGSGLISGQRLSARLEHHLQEFEIERLDRKFVAVATELGTGHEVWLNKGSLVHALRASFALPGIFRPVQINGRWLIDGALVNPIPVSVCRALGARGGLPTPDEVEQLMQARPLM